MFGARLFSGIILIMIAIVTMGIGGLPLLITLMCISLLGYRELVKALGCIGEKQAHNGLEIAGYIGIIIYYTALGFTQDSLIILMNLVGMFMLELLLFVVCYPRYQGTQVMAGVFAYLYAPVMLSFVYLTRSLDRGSYMVWLILISAWGCDTCAYVAGKLLGKRKAFPILSPHKTIAGCVGGVLGAGLLGAAYGCYMTTKTNEGILFIVILMVITMAGAIMSMVGDLAASAFKRNFNIKDYGNIIPGHGGIMDRFDSMIVTAPMIYFLTIILLSVN